MIYIKRHIENVEVSFGTKKVIPSLPHIHSSEESLTSSIPTDFTYNEWWTVHHNCSCDNEPISFSPTNNWNLVRRLFSRFHTYEFLETLAEVFDSLRVLELDSSDVMFLTPVGFNDTSASITQVPQVTFNYYSCERCGSEFLCRLSEGHPMPPDHRHHQGVAGQLVLHEIAEIGADGRDLQALLRIGRGEVLE